MSDLGNRKANLKARKSILLAEIYQLKPVQGAEETFVQANKTRLLQQEYNRLVEEEIDIIRQPLSDPLHALPPELWKELLPQTVDELLILTLVSTHWRRILTSTPLLWTDVVLDPVEGDYWAKAITCLYLSMPLEISLRIEVSLEQWKDVASRMIVEGDRMSSILYPRRTICREALDILAYFTELPTLRVLTVPFPPSTDSDISLEIFGRMPSLNSIPYLYFTAAMLNLAVFSNLEIVRISAFDQDTVEALKGLSKLKDLHLYPGATQLQSNFLFSVPTLSCFPSVTRLIYYSPHTHIGVSPKNAAGLGYPLWCMGQNLTSVDAGSLSIHDVPQLLSSFQRFPCLQEVYLHIDQEVVQNGSSTEQYMSCPSIQNLQIDFLFPASAHYEPVSVWKEREVGRLEGFARLFHCLAIVIPGLENLTLSGHYMVDPALEYIRKLPNLQSLILTNFSASLVNPAFVQGSLESQKRLYAFPTEFLDNIDHQSLRYLHFSTANPRDYLYEMFEDTADGSLMRSPRYKVSTTNIPGLTTLCLVLEHPILSDLTIFVGLRSLVFSGSPSITWASDFFEELLLRPNQWPLLEHIGLSQDFLEWDILILMLERRNFVAKDGVKHIATLEVGNIPHKLLYPITNLLGGKFPERAPISEFSISAIGAQLWNREYPGCQRCIRMFLNCKVPAMPTVDLDRQMLDLDFYQADRRLAWLYQLPHQRIRADPPLSYDLIQWLTGKQERRLSFAAKAMEGRMKLCRVPECQFKGVDYRRRGKVTIGASTLEGKQFEATFPIAEQTQG